METKFEEELKSFQNLWQGGYFIGNPLDPMAKSTYGELNFMSVLHVTYLRCIKPYVNSETVGLEIGPGRGAWTKTLLGAKEVWCIDALPEKQNKFFEYLGYPSNVKYFQVTDFKCKMLPENHFDYMFSFGCLCHVSFEGITEYAKNIYSKLKDGSTCFWMIADYNKFNKALSNLNQISILQNILPARSIYSPVRCLLRLTANLSIKTTSPKDEHNEPIPGRWYDAGIERTCFMLEKIGYKVIDQDVGVNHRDPVIHFIKG